jgi:hypothetical protein
MTRKEITEMKVFKGDELSEMKNPTPGKTYKKDLLKELNA